jgi:predicted nucleic acid-binding protein
VRVLVDTDVLIDFALDRRPHAGAAAELLELLEGRRPDGFIAWHSVSNFYYLVAPSRGKQDAREFLLELSVFLEIAPTTTESLRVAGRLPLKDFEDAMQVAAALACGADVIATRNMPDYARAPIEAVTPAALIGRLS